MPTKRKWNKFALAATLLFVMAWVGANFINHLVWLATSKPIYLTPIEAGISGLFQMLGVILPHIIVVILAVIALRKIKISGEKGKILSQAILVLGLISILLWVLTIFRLDRNVRELFTGDPYSQNTFDKP